MTAVTPVAVDDVPPIDRTEATSTGARRRLRS
jgi:hypothetical protein